MKLIAKTNVRYGAAGETAAPGETFELNEKEHGASVAQLIESGAAEAARADAKKPDPNGGKG